MTSTLNPEIESEMVRLILDRISSSADVLRSQWQHPTGTTTRHLVLDNVLPEEMARQIASAFPRDGSGFHEMDSFRERKKTLGKLSQSDPVLRSISLAFQNDQVVQLISRITQMPSLEGDRSFYAGGLSMMFPGDFLNPHIDNSHDGERNRYRRLNLLYYVNEGWTEESGGNFELWDEEVKGQKTIVAGFNRLVVMETDKHSWHSVSKVMEARPRCCVSNYYFSELSPDGHEYFHVTSFTGRPREIWRRFIGPLDNGIRNAILKTFKKVVPGKSRADKEG